MVTPGNPRTCRRVSNTCQIYTAFVPQSNHKMVISGESYWRQRYSFLNTAGYRLRPKFKSGF
ncbi:hypothetical protein C8R44DRAFT_783292, partial [Mycena epipterygia]